MNGKNIYEQGQILFMKFPYKDNLGNLIEKKRPVLVISKKDYNLRNNSLIICPITSNIRKWENSIFLDSNSLEFGSLKRDSELRVDLVSNIKKIGILTSIGFLKEDLLKKAILNLKDLISIEEFKI